MSDEKALLAAIWAHPHEDTPRLMYADWLDEHGQSERAEFIRVQIEAERQRDNPSWTQFGERAKQLLEAHEAEWIEPFGWISLGGKTKVYVSEPTPDGWGGSVELNWIDPNPSDMGDVAPCYERGVEFHRGFPRAVRLEPPALLTVPTPGQPAGPRPTLFVKWEQQWPDRQWPINNWAAVSTGLRSGWFANWFFTNFNYECGWVRPLIADSETARGVIGLHIEGDGHTEPDEAEMTRLFSNAPILEDVLLKSPRWTPNLLRALGSTHLGRLLRLDYDGTWSEHSAGSALRAMCEAGPWPQLVGLTLHGLEGVGQDVVQLIRPDTFAALKRLAFWDRGGTREFFSALLACPYLAHVQCIEYWGREAALEQLRDESCGRFVYK